MQQTMTICFMLIFAATPYLYLWSLCNIHKDSIGCHHVSLRHTIITRLRPRKICSVSDGLVNNLYSQESSIKRSQYWLNTREYCSTLRRQCLMWRGWTGIPYGNLTGKHCAPHPILRNMRQQISISTVF